MSFKQIGTILILAIAGVLLQFLIKLVTVVCFLALNLNCRLSKEWKENDCWVWSKCPNSFNSKKVISLWKWELFNAVFSLFCFFQLKRTRFEQVKIMYPWTFYSWLVFMALLRFENKSRGVASLRFDSSSTSKLTKIVYQ